METGHAYAQGKVSPDVEGRRGSPDELAESARRDRDRKMLDKIVARNMAPLSGLGTLADLA
jgi:hypothetical protein